jgi:hypothetical protein
VEANSTGGQGSSRAVAPSNDDVGSQSRSQHRTEISLPCREWKMKLLSKSAGSLVTVPSVPFRTAISELPR